jgi:uncharacterized membrane protein YGL010W
MLGDRSWKEWIREYSAGHQNPVNRACHTVGIPMIALSITLTGQSMIRSDIRAHAPSAVPVIMSLLKGDVIFTNFETTIVDEKKGQSHHGRQVSLAA